MFGNYKIFPDSVVLTSRQDVSRVSIFRQPSPLDEFLVERVDHADGVPRVFVTSDLSVFFNQQRLMSLTPFAQEYIANSIRKVAPDHGLTDAQLMDAIRSRYIQSNADVWTYVRAVESDIQGTISDYQKLVAEKKMQEESRSQPVPENQSSPAVE